MKRTIIATLVGGVMTTPALSASDIDKNYIKSLAAPGKTVLVIEYYDGSGKVADRKGYATTAGFKAVSPTDFRVDDKTTLRLYGLEPCKGEMVNRSEDFAGSCDDFAQKQLQIMLQNPKVVFCRAFVSEQGAPFRTRLATVTTIFGAVSIPSICSRSSCYRWARYAYRRNLTELPLARISPRPRRSGKKVLSGCGPIQG